MLLTEIEMRLSQTDVQAGIKHLKNKYVIQDIRKHYRPQQTHPACRG